MQFRLFALLVGITLVATSPASRPDEGSRSHSGADPRLWRRCGAGVVPVPEGFTYYLRADLGWGFSTSRSYSENGAVYGADCRRRSLTTTPFGFGGPGFVAGDDAKGNGVFLGTVGYGAYFTPRFRGDLTIDFRSSLDLKSESTYAYASSTAAARSSTAR